MTVVLKNQDLAHNRPLPSSKKTFNFSSENFSFKPKLVKCFKKYFKLILGMLKYENQDMFTGVFEHGVLNREGKLMMVSQGIAK
jgi:hypothetical protein